jgi:hypothetical protein
MSGFPSLALLALVDLLVMNFVFNVNNFLRSLPKKIWEEGHFTTFQRKAYHV